MINLGPLQCGKDVILIRRQKAVGRRHHVMIICERQIVDRELARQIGLGKKRIRNLAQPFHTAVFETIGHVTAEEEVRIQIRRSLAAGTEAETVDKIVGKGGIDGADVELAALLRIGGGFNKVFDKGFRHPKNAAETFDLANLPHYFLHAFFRLAHRIVGAILPPKLSRSNRGVGCGHLIAFELKRFVGQGGER